MLCIWQVLHKLRGVNSSRHLWVLAQVQQKRSKGHRAKTVGRHGLWQSRVNREGCSDACILERRFIARGINVVEINAALGHPSTIKHACIFIAVFNIGRFLNAHASKRQGRVPPKREPSTGDIAHVSCNAAQWPSFKSIKDRTVIRRTVPDFNRAMGIAVHGCGAMMVNTSNDVALLGQRGCKPRHLRHASARTVAENNQRKCARARGRIAMCVKSIHQRILRYEISVACGIGGIPNMQIQRCVTMINIQRHRHKANLRLGNGACLC